MYLLWRRLTQAGQVLWGSLDFSGSNITDLETRNHVDLQNHNTTDYFHLTQANHTDLTDGGDSTLHYHSADREVSEITLEAGENLTIGDTVKVSANKFYKATKSDALIAGIIKATTLSTFPATAVFGGKIALSGLSAGSPYFAGATSAISATAPTTEYVHRIGYALSSTILLVNIEEPTLLS
jgi:hypothetical protein